MEWVFIAVFAGVALLVALLRKSGTSSDSGFGIFGDSDGDADGGGDGCGDGGVGD